MPIDASPRASSRNQRLAVQAGVIAFAVVLAAGATILARPLLADAPVDAPSTLDPDPSTTPSDSAGARSAATTTRLSVRRPLRLVDPEASRLRPGSWIDALLPALPEGTTAVVLNVSLTEAGAPGAVTLGSSVERVPALRVAAAGGQTTATVVVGISGDDALTVRNEAGGRLQIDLVGAFEPAETSTSGRIVTTRPTPLVDLVPATDGNDATIDLDTVPALQSAARPSALLIRVSGDVGDRGGYVSVGPSPRRLDQTVYWSATTDEAGRLRPGFLLVPVRTERIHLEYHAGSRLQADLVGFVTGPEAADSTRGLTVMVPARTAAPVPLKLSDQVNALLVPARGLAGLAPDQISAALVSVEAIGSENGAVSVRQPGAGPAGLPDLLASATGHTALTLAGVADGEVTVTATAPARVVLTPRVLVLAKNS